MKKISKTTWTRYKESAEGKEVLALFQKLLSSGTTAEEMLEIAQRFDSEFFSNTSKKEMARLTETMNFFLNDLDQILSNEEMKIETGEDSENFYMDYLDSFAVDKEGIPMEDIPQSHYKGILSNNILMSIALYAYMPAFFIPNFFVMQFAYLKKFAEKYDIELPEIPNRSNYRERCLYYLDVCIAIMNFAVENDITDSAEICTFVYGCELPVIKDEYEAEFDKPMPQIPEQAWILVGNYGEGEKEMKHGFWQANELTCKGDIMLFYEKSPVKKLNSVWTALEDGVKDPFFHYYSHTYIGNKIDIPANMALTFEDFKNNDYFKKRSFDEKLPNYAGNIPQEYKKEEFGFCNYPFRKLTIAYNGDILLCCDDFMYDTCFGNVMKDSLIDSWNAKSYNDYRLALLDNRRIGLCSACNDGQDYSVF